MLFIIKIGRLELFDYTKICFFFFFCYRRCLSLYTVATTRVLYLHYKIIFLVGASALHYNIITERIFIVRHMTRKEKVKLF